MGQGADGLDPNKPVTHADLLPAQGGAGRGEAKGAAVEAIGGAIGGEQEKVQQLEQALARSVAQRRSDDQRRSVRPLRSGQAVH